MIITNHTENSFTDINTEAYEVLLVNSELSYGISWP